MHEMTFIQRQRNKKDREEGTKVKGGKTKSERNEKIAELAPPATAAVVPALHWNSLRPPLPANASIRVKL